MQNIYINIKVLYGTHYTTMPLRGAALAQGASIPNAYLIIDNELIYGYGSMEQLPPHLLTQNNTVDCTGCIILPSYCDSHTHIVYAGSREHEYVLKIQGNTYAEIAAQGGGILNSAAKVQAATEQELYDAAWLRLYELLQLGTGAIEIKSGYGLTVAAELKMLRVIQQLKRNAPIPIKATCLAAHAIPLQYTHNPNGYVTAIINELLPVVAKEQLADYVDVFCESNFYTVPQMERLIQAAYQYGLKAKVHVNQLNSIGGLQQAIALNALTVDHLETMTEQDVQDLAVSNTIGTMLPTAAYFLRMPYQPARQLIQAHAAVALASDYNPGSSPSGNMNMVVSMACTQLKMLPEEAYNAATINGAFAMELHNEVGSITVGKRGNFILTKPVPSLAYIPYSFGSNLIQQAYINGRAVE